MASPLKGPDGLTERQRLFVVEYIASLNATQAAINAGYSRKTADKIGHQLLGKTRVAEAIRKAMDKRAKKLEITADRVLAEYAAIGFARLPDFVTWEQGPWGTEIQVKPSAEIDGRVVASIKPIMISKTRTGVELKLHDKLAALEKLGQHLGMWKRDTDTAEGGLDVVIDRRGAP